MVDTKLIDMITDLVKAVQHENKEQNKDITKLSVQVAKLEVFRENMISNIEKIFKKFIRFDSEIKNIKKSILNERELTKAEKEIEGIKKTVSENSKSLLKIMLWPGIFVATISFIIGVLKWKGTI